MPAPDLAIGTALFHEQFEGVEGLKDRYFVVVANKSPTIECFTTTTKRHAETRPRLATEFCAVSQGESCLPKSCFVDFRTVYSFDDIVLSSRLRSRRVKVIGSLPLFLVRRMRDALLQCRTLSRADRDRLVMGLSGFLAAEDRL